MPIYQLDDYIPRIDPSAYVADSADLIGQVVLEAGVSIWSHVAIRADNEPIVIGEGSNVQEGSVLHVDRGCPMHIGPHVTVGHQAMLHGCTIESGALIGMQAIVLNNAVIGKNCLIGAGAIVPEAAASPITRWSSVSARSSVNCPQKKSPTCMPEPVTMSNAGSTTRRP